MDWAGFKNELGTNVHVDLHSRGDSPIHVTS